MPMENMDEMDNYPSEGGSTPSEGKSPPESIDEENAEDASKTALVSKSMCGGKCKVGDTVSMRVVADHGDEVELECCSDSESTSNKPEMTSDEEIDGMDQG